jgi:hypothetical protein
LVYVTNIKDAPGFSDIPFSFQATIHRVIFTSRVAKRYRLALESTQDGFLGFGYDQIIGLGYGDSVRESLNNLSDAVGRSKTPDKTTVLLAISNVLDLLANET